MKKISKLIAAVLMIFAISATLGCIEEEKLNLVEAGQIPSYDGHRIAVVVTPTEKLAEEKFSFAVREMAIKISKTRSAYIRHDIYNTEENVKIITAKNQDLQIGKQMVAIGTVKQDKKQNGSYAIMLDDLIEKPR